MDRFAQAKVCAEEGCGQPSAGKFSGKQLCKDHLQSAMGRAKQQIPVAEQGIQQSEGTERMKYERFKQVMKTQIDEGSKDLSLAEVNDKLHLLEKGSSRTSALWEPDAIKPIEDEEEQVCPTCNGSKTIKVPCETNYCENGKCSTCDGVGRIRNCENEECPLYYEGSPEDSLEHDCHDCFEGECEYCFGTGFEEGNCPDCSKIAQAGYGTGSDLPQEELLSSDQSDEAANATATFVQNQEMAQEAQANNLSCPKCGLVGTNQQHIDSCSAMGGLTTNASGSHCYVCGGPVSKENGVAVNVDGRSTFRHKNPVVCNEYKESEAYYAEPDSVLDSSDALSVMSSNIVCAMCGDDWDISLLDHNKVASLMNGQSCPTCDGAPLCMGCAHKFTAHKNASCGADEIRFDRRLASQVVAQCECDGYAPLSISYYDEHLESKYAAGPVVGWPNVAQPDYPPRSDDDIRLPGQDHPDDDGEGGNDTFPGKDIQEGIAHAQDHLREYEGGSMKLTPKRTHDVPVQHIIDHLGELATGVEPATCKVCGQAMELHAQWTPTQQKSASHDHGGYTLIGHPGAFQIVPTETCGFCGDKS